MKTCTQCKLQKPLNQFLGRATCKQCQSEYSAKRRRTSVGICRQMYNNQRITSRKRGHGAPSYTFDELLSWITGQPLFYTLYTAWVSADYSRATVPSCDRLDDTKGYSLDNLRLVAWGTNEQKQRDRIVAGINKTSRIAPILQLSLEGTFLKSYPSISLAAKATGIPQTQISVSAQHNKRSPENRRQAKGYLWVYDQCN